MTRQQRFGLSLVLVSFWLRFVMERPFISEETAAALGIASSIVFVVGFITFLWADRKDNQ